MTTYSSKVKIEELLAKISELTDLKQLSALEVAYLGRNGLVNQLASELKGMSSVTEKKEFGAFLNQLKNKLKTAFTDREHFLLNKEITAIDLTLPGKKITFGQTHPVTKTAAQIVEIFKKIGFYKLTYPEIEYEYFAFSSLNMPSDHPARDDFESFSVNGPESPKYGKMVLSPHTSSGQVREMLRRNSQPPIRMINISRCFRRNFDVTHTPMFHQFEGLCVDKGINITHLKGAILHFAREYFGYEVEIRLRPHHFQFTEPSFEVDISCTLCKGTGIISKEKCRVCKSGWLELGGTGMVHPNVLKEGKIDPNIYSGWAFGFGIERVYMMKYQLNDLRRLFSGELSLYNK